VSSVHSHDHVAQLFDTPESRVDAVFGFLRDGLSRGDAVLLIIPPSFWTTLKSRCRAAGVDTNRAIAVGSLAIRNAERAVPRVMRHDMPDWSLFESAFGQLVGGLRENGTRLRVYGDGVDMLARAGEFDAAERLERFWNELAERESLTLFCGYTSEHFGNPKDREALRRLCQLHHRVDVDPRDILGKFLLRTDSAC
jgi:hypothetical protein